MDRIKALNSYLHSPLSDIKTVGFINESQAFPGKKSDCRIQTVPDPLKKNDFPDKTHNRHEPVFRADPDTITIAPYELCRYLGPEGAKNTCQQRCQMLAV